MWAWLAGCGPGAADVRLQDTGTELPAPDITGSYALTATWDNCVAPPSGFGPGLVVAGPPETLEFAFGDTVLAGSVDAGFTVLLVGSADGANVTGEGLAFLADDAWALDIDVSVGEGCTGLLSARQEVITP